MKQDVNNPCFLCGATKSLVLFETTYPDLNYPGVFRLNKCDSCGLLFNSPRLSDDELYKLYGDNYYFFHRRDAEEFQRITSIYLRTIAIIRQGVEDKRVVEIGSANGYLLALLKRMGWQVVGIEISSKAASQAQTKFGIPTFCGTVEQYVRHNNGGMTFPLVLAIDLFEHIPQPVDFLKSIDSILEQDGLLIIDTPNGSSQNIQTLGTDWMGFNPFHIFLYSKENLTQLLVKMGYSIERVFSYNNRRLLAPNSLPQGPGVAAKAKAKSLLRMAGLHKHGQIAYRRLWGYLRNKERDIETHLSVAAQTVEKEAPYLETDDARDELAGEYAGDNIVVFARKRVK
jgi:2-polyprenyl-3-methyl-5-hydroxy-6-metoxy-1,4-benzoquinol methylase